MTILTDVNNTFNVIDSAHCECKTTGIYISAQVHLFLKLQNIHTHSLFYMFKRHM